MLFTGICEHYATFCVIYKYISAFYKHVYAIFDFVCRWCDEQMDFLTHCKKIITTFSPFPCIIKFTSELRTSFEKCGRKIPGEDEQEEQEERELHR